MFDFFKKKKEYIPISERNDIQFDELDDISLLKNIALATSVGNAKLAVSRLGDIGTLEAVDAITNILEQSKYKQVLFHYAIKAYFKIISDDKLPNYKLILQDKIQNIVSFNLSVQNLNNEVFEYLAEQAKCDNEEDRNFALAQLHTLFHHRDGFNIKEICVLQSLKNEEKISPELFVQYLGEIVANNFDRYEMVKPLIMRELEANPELVTKSIADMAIKVNPAINQNAETIMCQMIDDLSTLKVDDRLKFYELSRIITSNDEMFSSVVHKINDFLQAKLKEPEINDQIKKSAIIALCLVGVQFNRGFGLENYRTVTSFCSKNSLPDDDKLDIQKAVHKLSNSLTINLTKAFTQAADVEPAIKFANQLQQQFDTARQIGIMNEGRFNALNLTLQSCLQLGDAHKKIQDSVQMLELNS